MIIGEVKNAYGHSIVTIEAYAPTETNNGLVCIVPRLLMYRPEEAVEYLRLLGNAIAVAQGAARIAA